MSTPAGAERADELERSVALHDASTIAAVIAACALAMASLTPLAAQSPSATASNCSALTSSSKSVPSKLSVRS